MKDIKQFFTEREALQFINRYPLQDFIVLKELDGRFHVYAMS